MDLFGANMVQKEMLYIYIERERERERELLKIGPQLVRIFHGKSKAQDQAQIIWASMGLRPKFHGPVFWQAF